MSKEKQQKEESGDKMITLIPSFEEVTAMHQSFFVVNAFNGFNFATSKKFKNGIASAASISLLPLHFVYAQAENDQIVLQPEPLRNFSFSISKNFPIGAISGRVIGGGALGFEGIVAPSPFLIANGTVITDFKSISSAATFNIRQQFLNICVDFRNAGIQKPQLFSCSAILGTNLFSVGLKYLPLAEEKSLSYEALLSGEFKGIKGLLSFSKSNFSAKVQKQINENLTIGAQLRKLQVHPIPIVDFSWTYAKDNTTVHSLVSSLGTVLSEFNRTIKDSYIFSAAVKLDHLQGDYTFGLGITFNK